MFPMPDLVAVVTGGAGDIGRATARLLAATGRHVVVADIDAAAAASVAEQINGSAVAVDVGDPEAWEKVREHVQQVGVLDAVVLNAGIALGQDELLDVEIASYRRAWSVNVDGVVFGLRALVPLLIRSSGHAVVTASLAGLTAVPFDPVYAMTKHAVIGLVRSYAPALAAKSVGLHAVCPGLVDTAMIGAARADIERIRFPLIPVPDVAAALTACAVGDDPSEVVVCQPGRPPISYEFPAVPGPRVGRPAPPLPARLPLGTQIGVNYEIHP
jgi:NAD(P)-dependent dehydrogenase (short-subunit alcohol dehydrogenase family)